MSRGSLAWIVILVAVAGVCGRILSAHLVYEPNVSRASGEPASKGRPWPAVRPNPMATFSSNDRSRWATIRALVDEGTYAVGQRDLATLYATCGLNFAAENGLQAAVVAQSGFYLRTRSDEASRNNTGIIFEDGWQSVDKVLDPSTQKFYSSKPPLLSTLLAGLYWLLKAITGWTLAGQASEVVRAMLLLVNAMPFAIYLIVLARLGDRYAATEWGRLIVLAAAGFGTMVTPFLISVQNHTIATFCVLWALALALWMWEIRGCPTWCGKSYCLRWHHFLAAGALAAFAVCNELPALAFWASLFGLFLFWSPGRTLGVYLPVSLVIFGAYVGMNHVALGRLLPVQAEFGNPWYEYEASHWRRPEPGEIKTGIDWAHLRESRGEYAFHLLAGHHGFFALTPFWLVAIAGLAWAAERRRSAQGSPPPQFRGEDGQAARPLPWWLPVITLALTVVVTGFYLVKSDNYGGWTNGPRWLMWLAPLLLVSSYPAVDWLGQRRLGRLIVYAALFLSIVSASYRPWNPWRHPWLYDALVWLGWPGY